MGGSVEPPLNLFDHTTPSAPSKVASQLFIDGAEFCLPKNLLKKPRSDRIVRQRGGAATKRNSPQRRRERHSVFSVPLW
jgi:hypothetical protein